MLEKDDMLEKKNSKQNILFLVSVLYIFLGYFTLASSNEFSSQLFGEDQFFENIGVIGFFLTSVVFLYGLVKTQNKPAFNVFYHRLRMLLLLGFALLFFFGAGEEISWGQRIFNLTTPETLEAINAQGELNVHNINIFEYTIRFEFLFDVLWAGLTLLLPLAVMLFPPIKEFIRKFFAAPHIGVGVLFLLNYVCAKTAFILFETSYKYDQIAIAQAIQEIKESNYAVFFILAALSIVKNILSD